MKIDNNIKNFNVVYLSLGSNEGDSLLLFQLALHAITTDLGIIELKSSLYQTAAWGLENQPDFLNQVIELHTTLHPLPLMHALQSIEIVFGRKRIQKWGPRTLDIDILFFNDAIINDEELKIPHPYLHERRFTLLPFAEIAGSAIHPVFKRTINELLETCKDNLEVKKINSKPRP